MNTYVLGIDTTIPGSTCEVGYRPPVPHIAPIDSHDVDPILPQLPRLVLV